MLKTRLWGSSGKPWNNMRDIFLEPIIENLIRKQIPHTKIVRLIGRGRGWTARFIERRWRFNTWEDAKNFFETHYLGMHEVNDYLD